VAGAEGRARSVALRGESAFESSCSSRELKSYSGRKRGEAGKRREKRVGFRTSIFVTFVVVNYASSLGYALSNSNARAELKGDTHCPLRGHQLFIERASE